MQFPLLDRLLWFAGLLLGATLLVVLLKKRAFLQSPYFVVWIGFSCVNSISLFVLYRLELTHVYFWVFWVAAAIDLVLQVSVLFALARAVFVKTGASRVSGSKRASWITFSLSCLTALLVACTLSLAMRPAALTLLDSVYARCNLFMTALVSVGFTLIVGASNRYGLSWPRSAEQIGLGFTVWTVMSFLADTLHAYWRAAPYFDSLETLRSLSVVSVLTYWIISFSRHDGKTPCIRGDFTSIAATDVERVRG